MSDILSQDEVDALLTAVNSGDVDPGQFEPEVRTRSVVPYDFKRPNRVSKDQMRTLQMIHDSFARAFTTTLSPYLRTIVEVNLIAVDQLTYAEFILSLSNPTCINTVNLSPLSGFAVLELNPTLVFSIVDRLLGGKGLPIKDARAMTDIESAVLEKVIRLALRDLREVWQHVSKMDFNLEERETNPQFVQVVAPGEIVILITIEVKVGEGVGVMSLCFPYIVLEPIMQDLSAQHWINVSQTGSQEQSRVSLQESMLETPSAVIAEIGRARLSIQEILDASVGDVLRLDSNIYEDLKVVVANRVKFKAAPGIYRGKKSVKVTELIRDESLPQTLEEGLSKIEEKPEKGNEDG